MHDDYRVYSRYLLGGEYSDLKREVQSAKEDLLMDMMASPDYQPDALRNGVAQPMLFTRGGEAHTYNIICRPDDELFAGDMIDVFGQKWLVMEARADSTTHKTGIAHQCNLKIRFQNFSSEIIERWCFQDMSGYSSAFNSDTQLQKSEDQSVVYLPFDDETAKLFVDKRIGTHLGYEASGERILNTIKITGVNQIAESFNDQDHLLMLKCVRDVYSKDRDNIDLMICDYIPDKVDEDLIETPSDKLKCVIDGGTKIRIGTSRTYRGKIYDADGNDLSQQTQFKWSVSGNCTYSVLEDNAIRISVDSHDDNIGSTIVVRLEDIDGQHHADELEVEVIGIG